MKNKPKNENTKNSLKVLGGLFLSMLLLLTVVASADTGEVPVSDATTTTSSAGAQAIAIGNEVTASTQATITGDKASSSATAEAIASDGETAIAIVEVWANFADIAFAYAKAIATAIAGTGQTVHAYAYADASASSDGTATASTCVSAGSGGNACIRANDVEYNGEDCGEGGSGNGKIVPAITSRPTAISGFIFGESDIERYCTFKLHVEDDDPGNDDRAVYYMKIIAWEYGYTTEEFENKYKLACKN